MSTMYIRVYNKWRSSIPVLSPSNLKFQTGSTRGSYSQSSPIMFFLQQRYGNRRAQRIIDIARKRGDSNEIGALQLRSAPVLSHQSRILNNGLRPHLRGETQFDLPGTRISRTPQLQMRRKKPKRIRLTLAALAARLRKDFPRGVVVAFYQSTEPLAKTWSAEWAKRENAIASVSSSITPTSLVFDRAFSDRFNISRTLLKLSRALVLALTRTRSSGTPKPQPGKGPAGIRVLAFFSHGLPGRISIGRRGINIRRAKSIISAIASTLTSDVKIILYACSTARGKREKHRWVAGTMKPGGATGLAGRIRDFLVDQGKVKAETWGHTTIGHMTKNPALRVFKAAHGKAKPGEAYAAEHVFIHTGLFAYFQLVDEIVNQGYIVPRDKVVRFVNTAEKRINKHLYRCYMKTSRQRYRGHWLAEAAPLYPREVAKIIRAYWNNTYWPKYKKRVAKRLIKKLRLKKIPKP